jgi:hypothetical protein
MTEVLGRQPELVVALQIAIAVLVGLLLHWVLFALARRTTAHHVFAERIVASRHPSAISDELRARSVRTQARVLARPSGVS